MATPTRKPRKTRAVWQKLVNDFATAGQSVTDFCKSRQVSYPSFSKWRAALQGGSQESAGIVPQLFGAKRAKAHHERLVAGALRN